ncbi:MAG TPA: MarR family transcriptional regulator [Gaiellaceae bacterium]|jgi:DNA-binding MarR family transcriptional regulator
MASSQTKRRVGELEGAATFRTALRGFLRRTDEVTAVAGLTSQRYDLLLMLCAAENKGEGVRVTDLCELLHLPQTAVTELVKRANEAGLVERRSSASDGRVWLLRATPEGTRRLYEALTGLRGDRASLVKALAKLEG